MIGVRHHRHVHQLAENYPFTPYTGRRMTLTIERSTIRLLWLLRVSLDVREGTRARGLVERLRGGKKKTGEGFGGWSGSGEVHAGTTTNTPPPQKSAQISMPGATLMRTSVSHRAAVGPWRCGGAYRGLASESEARGRATSHRGGQQWQSANPENVEADCSASAPTVDQTRPPPPPPPLLPSPHPLPSPPSSRTRRS